MTAAELLLASNLRFGIEMCDFDVSESVGPERAQEKIESKLAQKSES